MHAEMGKSSMSIATYYYNEPNAPKPNSPTHIGTNVFLEYQGRLLLEQRYDCGEWGLIGGRLKNGERYTQGIAREVYEETGIRLPETAFHKLRIFDDNRIASYQDGTVWRMIIVLFRAKLQAEPCMRLSKESGALCFFNVEELKTISIVKTHRDLVLQWKPAND